MQQASKLLHSEPSYDDLAGPETERPGLSQNHRTSSFERPPSTTKDKLPERLEAVEKKVNRIVQLESDLQRQCLLNDAPRVTVSDQRAQMLVELQALQAEINTLSSLISVSVKPSNPDLSTLPDNEFLGRWRQLRDRVATLRQNMQTSPSHSSLFLARLKQLNNWVAHQDAAFRATVCPLTGNLLFILNLRDMVLTLMKENEAHRDQIEDALQQGRLHYGDGDDDEERPDANITGDCEFDSDGSELGQRPVGTRTDSSPGIDEQSRRVVRRIRRYLYHLKKRWFNLNASMLEYRQKLESVSERLSNFQSLFNDAVDQVRNAHAVTLRWMPVDCLPIERLGSELEQAQSFYEASEPLVVLLNNLDRQIAQFHESRVTIDPTVLTQQAALRNDFEHIRLQTETRIRTVDQALASTQLMERAQSSQAQPLLTTLPPQTAPIRHPSHRLSNVAGQFSRPELAETNRSVNQPTLHLQTQSPSTPQQRQEQQTPVPLMDSVSPPWERCVHPSGTQVPYYKNHSTQDTHWDHPILYELLQSMKQLNEVRFAEYRTALKLRKLQKTLCLDALSISILAENLKHIGHSQPLEGPNMDPFDRMINVPQMIDCLIQLFNRSNTIYGQDSRSGQGDGRNGLDMSDSSKKSQKCSTLPPGTKPLNVDDFHHQRNSPIKCGKGFRRHSSTTRVPHMLAESGDLNARRRLPTPSKSGVTSSPSLSFGNRSSSLPESVAITATSPVHQSTSSRGRRSSTKVKRRFLIGPAKHPVNVCVDLTLNWLLNVYDRMRQGHIRVLSFKVALTILAVANLDEKYRYLFSLIADSNGCVTEQRLSALLYECTLIPQNLGEGGWIGKEDFTTTVKLCFSQVGVYFLVHIMC
ncbi:hypothetical protein PHET_06085 [Paragonimus heterotremus]|uniref:WW domain-containing protein n=1 Tax=Paragonimus heterotremus TaxID=100268 RepID=A0A8J4TKB8_9TREM|nr:hypothetical protein PHET_06085 [Paragonimus heterotremus]